MTLREEVAAAGHAAVQKLLAEYDADLNRPVSQAECDRAFADAAIAKVLEWVAPRVEQFERPRMDEDDFTFIREAAAIRNLKDSQ